MVGGLHAIVDELMGNGRRLPHGEVAYHCPFCHHHKKKMQVNLVTQKWHCWVCNARGKTIFSLFKKLNASKDQFQRLAIAVNDTTYQFVEQTDEDVGIFLPKEFQRLAVPSKYPQYRNALKYLLKRGFTKADLYRYNIGYCIDGPYGNRIIVPSYDASNQLNYFIARTFINSTLKYKNPETSKNVIVFESEINWEYPLILVEGVFDAMKVKRNAIPMLGKFPSQILMDTIISKGVDDITLFLDSDAMVDSIRITERLLDKGIRVRLIEVEGERDAGDMTHEEIHALLRDTEYMTFSQLVSLKLKYSRNEDRIWQNI